MGPWLTGKVVCQMENKTPEKTKVIMFSKSQSAIRAEPALSLYIDSHKIPRYHIWQQDDFHKTLWGNFRMLQQQISPSEDIGQQKVGSKSRNHLQIYKQCVRPIFEYEIVSIITASESVINKIQRVQNSFIRLALGLPKYVSARLIHEASRLPYVRDSSQ